MHPFSLHHSAGGFSVSSAPYGTSDTSISMTATTATDPSTPVEYFFDETSGGAGGSDSGWQTSSSYVDTGLTCGTTYTYRVQTRDVLVNTGSWSTSLSATTTTCPPDELDQQQTQAKSNTMVFSKRWNGQSFIPTKPILTRVEVYIGKTGRPSSPLTLSVRSSRTGVDFVSISKPGSVISTTSSWVEFDFSNLPVTPGITYYLVLKTTSRNSKNYYYWGSGYNTPYTSGTQWNSIDRGSTWIQSTLYDFCFKTYGYT
jgi:hypothetical protein